jgi:hypothetical protein
MPKCQLEIRGLQFQPPCGSKIVQCFVSFDSP